jgi:hypothetical protein
MLRTARSDRELAANLNNHMRKYSIAAGQTMAELAAEHECGEATSWRALQ